MKEMKRLREELQNEWARAEFWGRNLCSKEREGYEQEITELEMEREENEELKEKVQEAAEAFRTYL